MMPSNKMTVCCWPQTAQYAFQHNSEYWEDAGAFRPERLLTGPGTSSPAWGAFGDVRRPPFHPSPSLFSLS